jgi:C1A family cysteine protease
LYKIKRGTLYNFAEQQLLDCSAVSPYNNLGCNGGYMESCFNYWKNNKVMLERDYPYTAVKGTCRNNGALGLFNLSGYMRVTKNDPVAHMAAVARQPIVVTVDASQSIYQFYKSGVISSTTCGTSINHAVTLIGYGKDSVTGVPFWLVKNSWGTGWGEAGYFRVRRDTTLGAGICGILQMSTYPTMV